MATSSLDGDAGGDLPGRVRSRFPIFERLVYLNSCSQGALSEDVRLAYEEYLQSWEEHGSPWNQWVSRVEEVRSAFAGLVNAAPDEVAITTSLSQGVNALLSGLDFRGRSTIVVTDFEFPTVAQIAHAQELHGRRIVHVPEASEAAIPLESFAAAIDDDTALVAMAHVCYRNGGRVDVSQVTQLAHRHGARVLLDAYQSAGAIPLDVDELGVDFLAAGATKYLLGSPGLAFFYCRSRLLGEIVPTQTGWFADEDIAAMDIRDYSPSRTARRFEAGTPPIPSVYAGLAGLRLVEEAGVAATETHVGALNELLLDGLDELGAVVVTPRDPARRGPLVAVASTDAEALVGILAGEGVVTSCRDGNLRVSAHCYNGPDDVEALLAALSRHRELLVPG